MSDQPLPKGFTCRCKKEYPFCSWVYAHWREALVLDCPCGMKTTLKCGRVIRQRDRSAKKKKKP